MDKLQGSMDRYSKRIRNSAINDLLQSSPTEGEDADSYNARIRLGLTGIDGVDPLQALQLTSIASKPVYDREARELAASQYQDSRDDTLFDQGLKSGELAETIDYNRDKLAQDKAAADQRYEKGKYMLFNDDYGKTWKLNKNTGVREPINDGAYGSGAYGGMGRNSTVMVDKTVPDSFGGSTTIKVPVNKYTGKDADGNIPAVVKQATLSQKDKDFTKNYGSGATTIDSVRKYLDPKYSGIWGGLDAVTGPVGNFFGAEEGSNQALAKQDLENLRLEATNKLTGTLSDADMKIILDTIPTINDQPEVAKAKLQKVETAIAKADANQFNRLVKSNPNAVKDMAIGMVNGTVPVPRGYQLVQYDDNSVALIPK
jgi:hypothetical protein